MAGPALQSMAQQGVIKPAVLAWYTHSTYSDERQGCEECISRAEPSISMRGAETGCLYTTSLHTTLLTIFGSVSAFSSGPRHSHERLDFSG